MGLGSVRDTGLFLTLAGGFIWNRKADKTDSDYAEQEYEKMDKTIGIRSGARYADLTGEITKIVFRTHEEFGENLNVYFKAGENDYIISIGLESRYCDDMLKALLIADFSKPLFMKPYDFVASGKRRQGISFRQDGEKLNLRLDVSKDLIKDPAWFKTASKKEVKRFFEDLTEHYVNRVKEEVMPQFKNEENSDEEKKPASETKSEKPKSKTTKEASKKVAPLAMRRFLKEYIEENYPDKEVPQLKGTELKKWYNLAQELEELPFEENEEEVDEEDDDIDLDAELSKLL